MSFKKRVSKSIALALVGVTVSTPILNSVSAMERTEPKADTNYDIMLDVQNVDFEEVRKSFDNIGKNIKGNIVEMEEEGYKVVIDKSTGDIEHTYYNNDGSIKETYSTNFYENINRFEEQFNKVNDMNTRLDGPVIHHNKTDFSPDMLQLKVKSVKKDGKSMHQCDMWNSKNQYKQEFRTKYTNSTSIMDFEAAINATDSSWRMFAAAAGTSAALAIAGFFVPGQKLTATVLRNALKALGFTNLLDKVDTLVSRWNTYSQDVINGNHKYNAA